MVLVAVAVGVAAVAVAVRVAVSLLPSRLVIATAKKSVEAGEPNFNALPCDILRSQSLPCPYKPPTSL